MCRSIAPLNVSPFIKTLRWTFLFIGIFYGANRYNYLKAYEEKARPKRHAEIEEKYRKLKVKERKNTIDEIIELGKILEVQEFTPGWEDDV